MISSPPRFKVPLSRSILNDPAFSPDPRSHPHFNASSYKFVSPNLSHPLPQHSDIPRDPHSPAFCSSSDSLSSFSSPTVSSATSQSSIHSLPSRVPSPVALVPPPLPIQPNIVPKPPHPNQPIPLPIRKSDSSRENSKPVPSHNRNTSRKSRMKALVRRITSRQSLDRIDELDETDPFGSSYHHDGPYEAIGNNFAQPSLPGNTYSNLASRRGLKFDPSPRPGQHQSLLRGSSAHGEMGLSLHLQPGQILRQNTVYTPHTSDIPLVSSQPRSRSDTLAIVSQSAISPSQSSTNPWTRAPEHPSTSLNHLDRHRTQYSLSSHAPRVEITGPDVPDIFPLHHGPVAAPYVLHQTETTVFPPPRRESKLHSLGTARSHTSSSFKSTSRRTQSTESAIPATRRHDTRHHKSVHSLDTSHSIKIALTQSPSIVQNKPPEPPRIRHLPKRLVMPAPLQPQLPPPQHTFPSAGPPGWRDDHLDDHDLEGAHFEGQPTMYNEEPRLLRKKSSSFPAKVPIPDHTPMSQIDDVSAMGNHSTKEEKEVEATTERTRRRKLSKRKYDI
ncbi:hypothetical protein JVU11DRAFT_4991 [Chiua virens]|nr:hypothetical protein JVU11DRAFT_4991 [Chiua virens]